MRGKGSKLESDVRFCKKEGVDTEFRKYRRGYDSNGDPRYQWRCVSCQSKSDMRSKNKLRDKINRIKSGAVDISALSGVPSDRADMIKKAWEYWAGITHRPDANIIDEKFVETCNHVISAMEYTEKELLDIVDAASYVKPQHRDPLDIKRLQMVLLWSHEENRAMKARSADSATRFVFPEESPAFPTKSIS